MTSPHCSKTLAFEESVKNDEMRDMLPLEICNITTEENSTFLFVFFYDFLMIQPKNVTLMTLETLIRGL